MSCPIEMEFAVDFQEAPNDPNKVVVKFALLQMRAMAGALKQVIYSFLFLYLFYVCGADFIISMCLILR